MCTLMTVAAAVDMAGSFVGLLVLSVCCVSCVMCVDVGVAPLPQQNEISRGSGTEIHVHVGHTSTVLVSQWPAHSAIEIADVRSLIHVDGARLNRTFSTDMHAITTKPIYLCECSRHTGVT